MTNGFRPALVATVLVLGTRAVMAQGISIADSGNPATLTVSTAVAGAEPSPVVDATTRYHAKTTGNSRPQKITGRLDADMPAGMTLTIELAPVTGATSLGPVTLSTTERDLVTNIGSKTNEWQSITYTLQATVAAGVVAGSRTVTLTITDWP